MRLLLSAAVFCLCAPASAWAADAPSWGEVGVRVEKPAGDGVHYSQGSGVYLGDGLVLTAAHVVNWDPVHPQVTILIDGVRTEAEVVFDSVSKDTDLAILEVRHDELTAPRRNQSHISLCSTNTPPDHPVVVAALGNVTNATTIPAPVSSMGAAGHWTNILSSDYPPGNSGGGVFDPVERCLWGIVLAERSGPINGVVVHWTAFAPASVVAPFLADFLERKPLADFPH